MKSYEEWFNQSDYDFKTANSLFKSGKYIYTVFMCHLAIEKALKGIWIKSINKFPVKTHNLIYLIEKINLDMPEDLYDFVFSLNRVSIPVRYPDNLNQMKKEYNKKRTEFILSKTKEAIKWLKKILKEY